VSVAAVVVVHEPRGELERCLAALAPQVDEIVVVANLPGELPLPPQARLLRNDRPLGYAANANRGVAEVAASFVVLANPDAEAAPDTVGILRSFAESRPRCGVAGPEMRYPDGTWQPSRRRFPTVGGTVVRRTPLRCLVDPYRYQRAHYELEDRPTEPAPADWMLGAFLLLRRAMLDELGGFDEGYRLYGEDIDLCYRAAKAGWERWYVPDAMVTHRHLAVTDRRFLTRRTLWHWRGIARFVRKHPERLRRLV
jgi:N-acetylglucosaminyl-diphospho-decaprenol L-rhamnosyltransferase